MSIEATFITAEGEPFPNGLILPGVAMSISDFSSGWQKFIVVSCLPSGRGGEVFEFDDPDFPREEVLSSSYLAAHGLYNRIALIYPRRSYERDFLSETRQASRAIFRHVPDITPDAAPPSANAH